MLFLIILLPFLGFLVSIFFGRFLGNFTTYFTVLNIFFSFVFSSFFLYKIILLGVVYKLNLFQWIYVDLICIEWSLLIDSLTAIMLFVVTLISTLVHLYSIEYMAHDPHLPRFMSYLSLFTFFMLILITANNFLQMFIGWEGVGLSSYLLINFWFTRIQANKAAIKAMLINRIGDLAILIAIFSIFFNFNTLDYDIVFCLVPFFITKVFYVFNFEIPILDFICIMLFCGAMGKSAQLGLHTWLPDAMEGPTPVSALIHAATMVTAGVFLIVRCSFLFEYAPFALNLIIIIGSTTAFFAATVGLFQNDLKRVIAYSTCSQLGYMIFSCGLSGYEIGLFHLSNHAFFKALLFLGAGSIIHAVSNEQDMRKMGGLKNLLPFSYSIMLIGSLALLGFPFLTGFYSKDAILELAYAKFSIASHYSYILGSCAAFCTAFYSVRLLCLVFLVNPNGHRIIILNAKEGNIFLGFPLFFLAFLSLLIGYSTHELFLGPGSNFWETSIFILPSNFLSLDIEFIDLFYKLLPLLFSLIGMIFAYFLYCFNLNFLYTIKKTPIFKFIYFFLFKKWYFDRIYTEIISQKVLNLSYNYFYKDIDRGLLEKIGPFNITNLILYISKNLLNLQSGFIFHYLFLFILSIFFLIFLSNFLMFSSFLFIIFLFLALYNFFK
jgi:proton-translocating NADH-quinone oxidoreductase chain L